jgi:2-C-methyl-D-erythritol 2,4-cyclodiphosphate synthase
VLLRRVVALLADAGFHPTSTDVTVVCDRPAIAPRRDDMRAEVAACLELPIDRVSVKATRPEGLGLAGDGVGCLALAVIV